MIRVAVGIVIHPVDKKILIAQRPSHQYGGGLWEFPGGKVEENEDIFGALQREFQEEIGIQVTTADPWITIEHDYSDRVVVLSTWLIKEYIGEPHGAEGQPIRWVLKDELMEYEFPAGNKKILEELLKL